MKKKQPAKQQSRTSTPLSTKVLTEEQLQQVVGGLNPQPLPPGNYPGPLPPDPQPNPIKWG